ncbi:MAG TPA: PaaI family thioesterase [Caulobacteraceae bacterium]|jgi:uncharacterized protein (TIGR00369 family)
MTTPPSPSALRFDVDSLNAFLARAFPHGGGSGLPRVIEAEPGRVRVMRPFDQASLRPGGVISGPTMMALADTAAYALVLAHIGEVPMAVTTSLTMHFLRPAKPGDLIAEGTLLRLGRRIATCDIRLWTEGPERLAAQATVAYAIPA